MRVSSGWTKYLAKYPVRANWMLNELARIKRHPLCVYQFPEAVCDYVSAGILHTARHHFKFLKAICGTVNGTNHVWLHDTNANVYLDFTVGQFNSVGYDIMAGSREDLEVTGYTFEHEDLCDEIVNAAEKQYLEDMSKLNKVKNKKGGKRQKSAKRKTRRRL
jgi:hypothetical protein